MKKETLLSYVGKGIVNHEGYKINVTNDYLERTKLHYLQIELKPINDYTDSAFYNGFLEYMSEKDLQNIEESFKEAYDKMKRQEQLNNIEPLKLIQINNLSNNYIASFRDKNKNEYVLIESVTEGKVELCKFHIEPEYDIKIPIEIQGQVINPKFSFWLDSAIYNKEEFMKVLDWENIEEEEMQ